MKSIPGKLPIFFFALLSAVPLTASFPKIGYEWMIWFALTPFLLLLNDRAPSIAFRIGWLTGFLHFLSLLYWLIPTMCTFGHLPLALSVLVLVLFAAYLGLFPAFFAWLTAFTRPNPFMLPLIIPLFWTAAEFGRAVLFTGFPWALLGHSQFQRLPLIQIADITGVYGISALIAMVNASLWLMYLKIVRQQWFDMEIHRSHVVFAVVLTIAAFSGIWIYGIRRMEAIDQLASASDKLRVAVVQGNVEQSEKWDPAFRDETIRRYAELSTAAAGNKPDLTVWPETAAPFYFLYEHEPTLQVLEIVKANGGHYLIGSPSFDREFGIIRYFNSAFLVSPQGEVINKYDKAHLVPYGEYVPLKKWMPFLGKMVEQVGDFTPGPPGRVLPVGLVNIGVQICYEIVFADLCRAIVRNQGDLIVNITNDAWYGRTSGPYQHFSQTVFRAVESRRALARSANTGISGFIDPAGRILQRTQLLETTHLTESLPILRVATAYSLYGEVFAVIAVVLTLLFIGGSFLNKRRASGKNHAR